VERLREVANSVPLRPFVKRGVMPGNLERRELESFVRDAATTYWHETCTAKMGRDEMSVVDGRLNVYGVDNLRIADGSIMPNYSFRHRPGILSPQRCFRANSVYAKRHKPRCSVMWLREQINSTIFGENKWHDFGKELASEGLAENKPAHSNRPVSAKMWIGTSLTMIELLAAWLKYSPHGLSTLR
jgi:hypothetical protein